MSVHNVLITGGTGFLGSHLVELLSDNNYRLTLIKRSFSDTSRLDKISKDIFYYNIDNTSISQIFDDNDYDAIIHLATSYGRDEKTSLEEMIYTNITFPSLILREGLKNDIKLFLNSDTSVPSNYNFYSATKSAFRKILDFYSSGSHAKFVNLKLHYMYGENDDFSKFIPMTIKSLLGGNTVDATEGFQKRDFIYVKDVAECFLAALINESNLTAGRSDFEVGTGKSISLRDFVSVIEEITGKRNLVNWGYYPYRDSEIFDLFADIRSTKKILKWNPETDIYDGLKRTIMSYQNQGQ